MKWSNNKPNTIGFYFVKECEKRIIVVEINKFGNRLEVSYAGSRYSPGTLLEDYNPLCWSERIQLPDGESYNEERKDGT